MSFLSPLHLRDVPPTDSDLSDVNSNDSPPARRQKLAREPSRDVLASWRARKRKLELRRWNLQSGRTKPRSDWEVRYIDIFVDDLREGIGRAATVLGRKPRMQREGA